MVFAEGIKRDIFYHDHLTIIFFKALLYTQAQYKNFDSIPNDSLINIALHHYSDNHNRELYTRALIYKGAVMQELGKEQEAMEWYKRAEDNASPDDYMNLGQANLRMAMLYALNYADNDETLEKERRALRYFRKAGSKSYELMCLSTAMRSPMFLSHCESSTDSMRAFKSFNADAITFASTACSFSMFSKRCE